MSHTYKGLKLQWKILCAPTKTRHSHINFVGGVVYSVSHVWLFVTPRNAAHKASLSFTTSWSLLKLMSSQWCHPTISSSVVPFSSCLQSCPASGSFPVNQLFASGGQSFGASASSPVLSMNIQSWFPVGLIGLIPLLSKGLSEVFFSTMVWSQTIKKPNQTKKRAWLKQQRMYWFLKLKSQKAWFWYSSAHSLRGPDFFFLFLFSCCQLYPEDLPLRSSNGFQWVIGPYAPLFPAAPERTLLFLFFLSALVVCPGQKSQWRRGTSYAYWPSPDHGCHLQSQMEPPVEIRDSQTPSVHSGLLERSPVDKLLVISSS